MVRFKPASLEWFCVNIDDIRIPIYIEKTHVSIVVIIALTGASIYRETFLIIIYSLIAVSGITALSIHVSGVLTVFLSSLRRVGG